MSIHHVDVGHFIEPNTSVCMGIRGVLVGCGVLSSLVSRLSSLVSRLSSLVSRLSSLVSRLSSLVSRLSSLVSRLSSLVSRLSSLVSRLSSLVSRHSVTVLLSLTWYIGVVGFICNVHNSLHSMSMGRWMTGRFHACREEVYLYCDATFRVECVLKHTDAIVGIWTR